MDADAEQDGVAGFPGAVFFVGDDGAATRFAADPRFRDPQRIVESGDGGYFLVDFDADPDGRGGDTGAVFRLDEHGAVTAAWSPACLVAPTSLLLHDRRLLIADRRARSDGVGQGVVFRLDPGTGECSLFAADPRFKAPADLRVDASGGVLLLDADAAGASPLSEGAVFQLDAATGKVVAAHPLAGTISPLGLLPEPAGTWLVFDVNADPKSIGGPVGAVFRHDPASGSTTLVASLNRFRDPARGCCDGSGFVVFVDANADPNDRGPDKAGRGQNPTGPGAMFRLHPGSGEVELFAAPDAFTNPVDVLRLP